MENKDWYNKLNKSQLTPPNYVFSYVWSILYLLMFISYILVWLNKDCYPYCPALSYFLIQLFFNLIWTDLFFRMKMPEIAFIDIIIIIIFTILTYKKFIKYSNIAGNLLIPYIIWLCFASYLNLYVILKN